MCGIVGIVGKEDVAERLLDGLRRLEYRGYDSAGIATVDDGRIARRRASGKLVNLARELAQDPLAGTTGIAHTRWATHGGPTTHNAHPHATDEVALVHNGIIENFKPLREELIARGCNFESETDTEVVAHLVSEKIEGGMDPADAVAEVLPRLHGAFALAILFRRHPELLIGARLGSPLVVGYGDGETYLGSDALALAPLTQRIAYLEEGDWVVIDRDGARIFDKDNQPVERPITISGVTGELISKGNHRHYMLKEIYEQPIVVAQTLRAYLQRMEERVTLPIPDFDLGAIRRVTIVACGTSFYAGMVAKYWFEQFARVAVDLDVASEFRYRAPVMEPGGLMIVISQSGETADTLAALRHAKAEGQKIAAVVNVPTSTMAREADLLLPTHAGPEIGVASTKAYTSQCVVMALLALYFGRTRHLSFEAGQRIIDELAALPGQVEEALETNNEARRIAAKYASCNNFLYLGRQFNFPTALEGALKLKEISYIHAEGYPAAEMKHGPIALVDEQTPSVFIVPQGPVYSKVISNMEEIKARGGPVIAIVDKDDSQAVEIADEVIRIPAVPEFLQPIVTVIPLQLLAYHAAIFRGCDVDKPRNLAKSVTVE
jgi:glucosamine--fructose-6-phosphate aminotransferase (isomerizing)